MIVMLHCIIYCVVKFTFDENRDSYPTGVMLSLDAYDKLLTHR